MKPNWQKVVFRAVIVISIITAIGYEVVKAFQDGYPFKALLSSDNGLIFALKFVVIPVCLAGALWRTINWIRKGVYEPRKNWDEGMFRVGILMFVILSIATGVGVFIWSINQNWGIGESFLVSIIAVAAVGIIVGGVVAIIDWLGSGFNE